LKRLNVNDNEISKLDNLPSTLISLDIKLNYIHKLENLSETLTSLDISYNVIKKLENLPEKLIFLKIDRNNVRKLENLPKSLTFLDISYNQIKDLSNIKELIFSGQLNPVWDTSNKKNALILLGNPLSTPPNLISRTGKDAIIRYLKEKESKEIINNKEIKLFLLGNSTAGKTSITKFLTQKDFNPKENTTHGIKVTLWKPNTSLEINIWDFGGQEYYHATHRLFLSDNSIFIVVWDSGTNKPGFLKTKVFYPRRQDPIEEELEHFHFSYWLDETMFYCNNGEIIICQNKCDKNPMETLYIKDFEKYSLNQDYINIKLSTQNAYFELVNNKENNWLQNFRDFEEKLIKICKKRVEQYTLIKYWVDVKNFLYELKSKRQYLEFKELEKIVIDKFDDKPDMENLMVYLKDVSGSVMQVKKNNKNIIYIDPNWINDTIYSIFDYSVKKNKGKFDLNHVLNILNDRNEADNFIDLIKENKLIFELSDLPGIFIAPQFLPFNEPENFYKYYARDINVELVFTLHFPSFLPRAIIAMFIAKNGENALDNIYWKFGIAFHNEKLVNTAIVIANHELNTIHVKLQKKNRVKFADIILADLVEIIGDNIDFEISVNNVDFIKWKKLIEFNKGRAQYSNIINLSNTPLGLTENRTKIFISYSKDDKKYLDEINKTLKPLKSVKNVDIWDDLELEAGEKWKDRILKELNKANIFIFLLSRNALATDFITNIEIEEAIENSSKKGSRIVPIIIENCAWEEEYFKISEFNACPGKGTPIKRYEKDNEEDIAYKEIYDKIKNLI